LKAWYETVKAKSPRQCGAIEQALGELSALEDAGREDPDAAAACFGAMMREIFVFREDRWAESLRNMADALGRFVYLLDAAIDLEDDVSTAATIPSAALPETRTTGSASATYCACSSASAFSGLTGCLWCRM
jgi:hypothetical protein